MKGFDSFFIKIYQVWLWLLLILSSTVAIKESISFVISYIGPNRRDPVDTMIFLLAVLLWIAVQSVYGLQAISQRSIQKANITCWMVTLGLIPTLSLDIYMIILLAQNPHPNPNQGTAFLMALIIGFSTQILLHISISMVGAFKVKKILLERDGREEMLDEGDDFLQA